MRTRLVGTLTIAAFALTACGGGDGAGGSQGEVADLVIESAAEEGLELDEDCVRETAGKLSDDDADKIVAAGADGDPDVSEEADALGAEMFGCVNTDALVDQMVEELGGEGIDTECLKDALRGVDAAEIAAGNMPEGIFECIEIGG